MKVLVPIADGSEDIETTCITDVLARAGIAAKVSSVMPQKAVKFARGLQVMAESLVTEEKAADYDAVVVPGGMPGASHTASNAHLIGILKEMKAKGKLIAAICASPAVVFAAHGLLEGVASATCYPAMKDKMPSTVQYSTEKVVVEPGCVTSQGPGTAIAFALTIASILVGAEKAAEVAKGMLVEFIPPKL